MNSKQEELELGHDILIFSILIIGAVLAFLYLPAFLVKRAIAKVRQTFCRHGAIGVENAKTVEELGLTPPSFMERLTRPRNYKPRALQYLKQAGEVLMTGDGRLYMVGEKGNERLKDSRSTLMKRRWLPLRWPGSEK